MSIRLLQGDCRVTLPTLDAGSVQACISSPPYWGLRSYIADGDPLKPFEIGLEPTPELWIQHLVEVFREVRRVLRPDGTFWLNLGDAMAGSGNGAHDYRDRVASNSPSLKNQHARPLQRVGPQEHTEGMGRVHGYKPKDLMLLPFRVAMALQADGWWIRSCIPWLKRNAMPESVTDRPSTSVEYVFLLAKSSRYYWDADAVRLPNSALTIDVHSRYKGNLSKNAVTEGRVPGQQPHHGTVNVNGIDREFNGRNRRNGDWFFESWQGLLRDEDGDPLALVVNPQPFKGSHFATFPPKLVEPMVKASTSEKGQCPECGAPWMRVVDHVNADIRYSDRAKQKHEAGLRTAVHGTQVAPASNVTTGWRPSCAHADLAPVPQTVLDCFGGAGTCGLVADRLGRNAVLCELKDEYTSMGTARITGECPMFTEVAAD